MRSWLRQLLRDQTGDADEMALLCLLGGVAFVANSCYAVMVNNQPFNAQDFGIGFGAFVGAAAAGMGYKSKQEAGDVGKIV